MFEKLDYQYETFKHANPKLLFETLHGTKSNLLIIIFSIKMFEKLDYQYETFKHANPK